MLILKSKDYLFEQIVLEYKKLIEFGVYKNGDSLPSCRELARERGINPNTVSKAYSFLEKEGYVQAVPKKGVFVTYEKELSRTSIAFNEISRLHDSGVTKEEILEAINKIYGGEKW